VTSGALLPKLDRRGVLKAAAAAGIVQLAAPFTITARAADEIKFGLDDPLTGTYAELGKRSIRSTPKAASSAAKPSFWSKIRPAPIPAPRCRRRAS